MSYPDSCLLTQPIVEWLNQCCFYLKLFLGLDLYTQSIDLVVIAKIADPFIGGNL